MPPAAQEEVSQTLEWPARFVFTSRRLKNATWRRRFFERSLRAAQVPSFAGKHLITVFRSLDHVLSPRSGLPADSAPDLHHLFRATASVVTSGTLRRCGSSLCVTSLCRKGRLGLLISPIPTL